MKSRTILIRFRLPVGGFVGRPVRLPAVEGTLVQIWNPLPSARLNGCSPKDTDQKSVQRLPGRVESADIVPLDTISEFPSGVFSRDITLNADNGNKPGLGMDQIYSSSRWSRRELKRLAALPGRKAGKVAVIGAGPAGLAAAHDLALLGYDVTVFEAGPKTGGMMRYGVPIYRIDQEVMDLENDSILNMPNVEVKFNTPIGDEITLNDLRRDYDAVFLGMGLQKGRMLNLEGSDLDGVVIAVDLLLNYNMGYKVPLGQKVLVVGGGDVAMDAARTALRLGQNS